MKRKLTKRQMEVLRRVVMAGITENARYYPPMDSVEMEICRKLSRRGYTRTTEIGWGFSFYATVKGVMTVRL